MGTRASCYTPGQHCKTQFVAPPPFHKGKACDLPLFDHLLSPQGDSVIEGVEEEDGKTHKCTLPKGGLLSLNKPCSGWWNALKCLGAFMFSKHIFTCIAALLR